MPKKMLKRPVERRLVHPQETEVNREEEAANNILDPFESLRSILLDRLDREYAHYRSVIEQTLSTAMQWSAPATAGAWQHLGRIEARLARLESISRSGGVEAGTIQPAEDGGPEAARDGEPGVMQKRVGQSGSPDRPVQTQRIRWGDNQEQIRQTIFDQLDKLRQAGQPVTTETIKQCVPGMLRWLYGQQKLFDGIDSLREAYERWRREREPQQDLTAV